MSSAPINPGRMDDCLAALKRDVAAIKARLDAEFPAIRREIATTADVERMGRIIIIWSVGSGSIVGVAGIVLSILRFGE